METLRYGQECYNIVGAAMKVHRTLGCGFTEYVYQDAMEVELSKRGIPFTREKRMKVHYEGIELAHEYIADFVCYDHIIVELKAVSELLPVHEAQTHNYLKIMESDFGLLINFGQISLEYERITRFE